MTEILLWVWNNKWSIPVGYILVLSVWAMALTCYDKYASKKRTEHRVRETTLFAVSALGGSVAMLLTMMAVRHKTRHKRFMIGIPHIILLQLGSIVALAYLGIITY